MSIEKDIEELEKLMEYPASDYNKLDQMIQKCAKKIENISLRNECDDIRFIEIQEKITKMKTPTDISNVSDLIDKMEIRSLSDDIDLSIVYSDFLTKAQTIKSNIQYLP